MDKGLLSSEEEPVLVLVLVPMVVVDREPVKEKGRELALVMETVQELVFFRSLFNFNFSY